MTPGINPDYIPPEFGIPAGVILTIVVIVQHLRARKKNRNVNR